MPLVAIGLTFALVAVVSGCGEDELSAEGATEAAQRFFGYVAEEDAENFCAILTAQLRSPASTAATYLDA